MRARLHHYALFISLTLYELLEDTIKKTRNDNVVNAKGLKQTIIEKLISNDSIKYIICENIKKIDYYYYKILINTLKSLDFGFIDALYRTNSKLLIGASSSIFEVIFEVGLAWDMLFDVPYIPGSSLKGAVRSWVLRRCSELNSVNERRRCGELAFRLFGASSGYLVSKDNKDEKEWFREVFGGLPRASEAWAGLVSFYDAYPVSGGRGSLACGLLEPDILTPHYYRGGNPVSDEFDVEPVPVPHLVIAPGTVFRVVVSLDPGGEAVARSLAGLLRGGNVGDGLAALAWIITEALGEGIGARTGKGYGALEKTGDYAFAPVSLRLHRRSGNLVWE